MTLAPTSADAIIVPDSPDLRKSMKKTVPQSSMFIQDADLSAVRCGEKYDIPITSPCHNPATIW